MAISVEKVATYFHTSGLEDWEVAKSLVASGKNRHGLFFAHLAVEKLLKSHVTHITEAIPPKIHNLPKLAVLARLKLGEVLDGTLGELNAHNMQGRYAESFSSPAPSKTYTAELMMATESVIECLRKK